MLSAKKAGDEAYRNGKFSEANENYLTALVGISTLGENKNEELFEKITLNMAMTELESGNYNKAISLVQTALNKFPKSPLANFKRGVVDLRREEFTSAMYGFELF